MRCSIYRYIWRKGLHVRHAGRINLQYTSRTVLLGADTMMPLRGNVVLRTQHTDVHTQYIGGYMLVGSILGCRYYVRPSVAVLLLRACARVTPGQASPGRGNRSTPRPWSSVRNIFTFNVRRPGHGFESDFERFFFGNAGACVPKNVPGIRYAVTSQISHRFEGRGSYKAYPALGI